MAEKQTDVLILGAGLTGLALAYLLSKHKLKVTILEARDRVGGRILTRKNMNQAPVEMGATWIGEQHFKVLELLKDLGLETFEQAIGPTAIYQAISTSPHQLVSLPESDTPSFRVQQGTQTIIYALVDKIGANNILLEERVSSISKAESGVEVVASSRTYGAKVVVSTLPPMLFESSVEVKPSLPSETKSIARNCHTWMGDSIKIALTYTEKFWNMDHLSGTIFSNVGPIPEMYDHSNVADDRFALMGFLNGAFYGVSKEKRLVLIMEQLERYYGAKAQEF